MLQRTQDGRHAAGRHEARSAGSSPAGRVQPQVVEVMREVGVDLEGRVPQMLEQADVGWADLVVTMGCGDACPSLPGKRYVDWKLRDPDGLPLGEVRRLRDEIATLTRELAVNEPSATGNVL